MDDTFDAIIVGAGVAGTTTAILLARAGWSVAMIEKMRFPRRKVCGECVAASNVPLLYALGIGEAFTRLAGPAIREIGFMQGKRIVHAQMPAGANRNNPWGRALGREALDLLLLEQAQQNGVQVFQPAVVEQIEGHPGAWTCQARMVESNTLISLSSRVLVDAHGSWESLRSTRAASHRPHADRDLLAFKANFSDSALNEGFLPILAFLGGYGGMVKAHAGVTTLACCIRRDRLARLRARWPGVSAGETVERYLTTECAGVAAALVGSVRDGPWMASGPLRPGIRPIAQGDPFRVGNAAGEAHPIIGEGMSMGFQSAFLLCGALTAQRPGLQRMGNLTQDGLNRQYHRQWRRHFAPRLRLAASFAHVAMRPMPASLLATFATRFPALLEWGAGVAGKTRCAVTLSNHNSVYPADEIPQ